MTELSDILEIAKACGKWKKYTRGVLVACPCHRDHTPSCALWYGNGIILCKCFAGCESHDIVDALRLKGFTLSEREQKAYCKRDLSQVATAKRPFISHDSQLRTMLARDLWAEGHSAVDSPVAVYLANRGLDLSVVPDVDRTIRFHPHCPRGKDRQAAMICSMRDVATDQLIGVHRTYLLYGRKDGAMMLGASRETAVKLTPHRAMYGDGKTFAPRLCVCEGVETGIGALALGYGPVWALGNAGAIERFQPLLQVGELIVLADHDFEQTDCHGLPWRPGSRAAQRCVKAWRSAGWRAHLEMPRTEGEDWADVAAFVAEQKRAGQR